MCIRDRCELVDAGVVPGLIGYVDGSPAGWISLGPRKDYAKLPRSPIMKPVDDRDVWSVVCTFVAKSFRGQGVQHRLLQAAIRYAREQGVRTLEAYPVDKPERSHNEFMSVSYTHLRAHETVLDLVCRLLLEKKKNKKPI